MSDKIENVYKKKYATNSKPKILLLRLLVKQKVKYDLLPQAPTGSVVTDKILSAQAQPPP